MDYKFTFQDGSEALMHYGIRGMKWGVWNSETKAKYSHLNKFESGNSKAYERYEKAQDKVWSRSNSATAHPNKLNKALLSRSVKKRDKAVSDLADSYIDYHKKYHSDESAQEYFDYTHKRALRDLPGNAHRFGVDTAMKFYAVDIKNAENHRQMQKAVDAGKEAVERYIRYGTTADQQPRSAIEEAAKGGAAVKTEAEGKRYKKLRDELYKSKDEFDSAYAAAPGDSVSYRKEADRKAKAQKEYDKFVTSRKPKVV